MRKVQIAAAIKIYCCTINPLSQVEQHNAGFIHPGSNGQRMAIKNRLPKYFKKFHTKSTSRYASYIYQDPLKSDQYLIKHEYIYIYIYGVDVFNNSLTLKC